MNENIDFMKRCRQIASAMRKQEIWRQKQIDIYYRKGRPLFKTDKKVL
jgi:hypothetical protein|uniref:Uncharacterized protein n=1 Tax=viral metagenome TaxID=1070528 RepID=A0A6C0IIZ6_9ZZZZ